MKKIRKIKKIVALTAALLFVGVSCSDEFLEVAPTGTLADAQVSTLDGIEGLLIGAYSMLNGYLDGNRTAGPSHYITGSVLGGDANKGSDPGDIASLATIQRYQADPTFGEFNSLWNARYEGISRCNAVLATIDKSIDLIPAAKAASLRGQARMLRGHFYFDLKKNFNNIVVFDETVPATEIPLIPNNGDAWAQIEADFQFAYDNLDEVTDAGRVNKWAAGAYMGKAKLYQQKYAEALTWFNDVIANGVTSNGLKYQLLDDYAQIFNADNDNHAEAVMDVESSNETGSVNNSNWWDDLNYPYGTCLLYTSPSPRDGLLSRMPSSA